MKFLITGANGAMAQETIKHLIKNGHRDIVMATRSKTKGESAKNKILKDIGFIKNLNLTVVPGFDMNKPLEIKKAVSLLKKHLPFQVVFLAAGFAVFEENYQSINYNGKKIEKTIFQNLIGSHIVFNELEKSKLLDKKARIVLAGGEGARGIKGMIDKPEFSSSKELREYIFLKSNKLPKYNPMNAIGVSKFVGGLWIKKMAELNSHNFDFIWFSPGLTSGSAGLKSLPILKRVIFAGMFKIMNLIGKSQSPKKGGEKYADCLLGKIGTNGKLIGAPKGKTIGKYTEQTALNPLLNSKELRDELWKILQEIEG